MTRRPAGLESARESRNTARPDAGASALRSAIGWTRAQWVDEAAAWLGTTAMQFFAVRLRERNGGRDRQEATRALELALSLGAFHLVSHPVRRSFDRPRALRDALRQRCPEHLRSFARVVEGQFVAGGGRIRHGVGEDDIGAFCALALEALQRVLVPGPHSPTGGRGT